MISFSHDRNDNDNIDDNNEETVATMATAHADDPAAAVSSCLCQTEHLLPRMFRKELRQLLSSSGYSFVSFK